MIFSGANAASNPEYYADYIRDRKKQNGVKSWDVSLENTPMLVTFDNLNDPKSVRSVIVKPYDEIEEYTIPGRHRPGEIRTPVEANFNKIFGEGVTFKPVHVERVYFEPITRGNIEKILPWLVGLETMLNGDGAIGTKDLAGNLSRSYFIAGDR